jgi:hypothetical protein
LARKGCQHRWASRIAVLERKKHPNERTDERPALDDGVRGLLAEWTDNTHPGFRFWDDLRRIIFFPSSRAPSTKASQPFEASARDQRDDVSAPDGHKTTQHRPGKRVCQAAMQWEIAAASAVVWHVDRWAACLVGE